MHCLHGIYKRLYYIYYCCTDFGVGQNRGEQEKSAKKRSLLILQALINYLNKVI